MNLSNSLKAAKIAVTSKAGRSVLKVQKQSPHLLFGIGVVGVVGTAVLASKATLNLDKIVDNNMIEQEKAETHLRIENNGYEQKHYDQDIRTLKLRLAREIVWLYTPTVVCGAVTIGCFTSSHIILHRRYVGVVAAYAGLDRAFSEYRQRVTSLVGEDKERELYLNLQDREIISEDGSEVTVVKETPGNFSQYAKLFASYTTKEWEKEADYRYIFLRCQEKYATERLRARGHLFLNEVYESLGFEHTSQGSVVGWVYDNPTGVGDNYVDFGIFTDRSRERIHDFMTTKDGEIWLDFNVDGVVWDLIDKKKQG